MKIFHGPQNIGGMAGVLAKAQRELGVQATSHCFPNGHYGYHTDVEIPVPLTVFNVAKLLGEGIFHYNVFQFYFGQSLTGSRLKEVVWLKKLGKKIFFYFCGCDIRDYKKTIEKYESSACKHCWPRACSPNRELALKVATTYADGIFVSTPDLLEFVPGSILLPQPIDLAKLHQIKAKINLTQKDSDFITIAHAPTNRQLKGTCYVEKAIQELQASGYQIKLKLIEGMPYEEALAASATADIVIDQLLHGCYGQYAVEMMAFGKPVICYMRDDLVPHYPMVPPLVSANLHTITDVLKKLIDERNRWLEIGMASVHYVNQVHDSKIVANKLIDAYRQ